MKEILLATSAEQLGGALAQLDRDVPERHAGRRNQHAERYCIAHLLATIPVSRLSFPLALAHADKPDFVLSMPSGSIGIEHTEAVPENVARAQFLRDKGSGPDVFFTPHATPGEPRKTAAELREEIEADEPGDGWVGDSAEREWAAAITHYVQGKIPKATAPGFARHPENWLMVYDNWPLPHISFRKAAEFLHPLLKDINAFAVFDAVFILDDSQICELRDSPIIYSLTR
ncbi:hypothetical protein ED208_15450 [Stagnimonas aquatica]|uniref:Uncharacterized protein n=1 Tax=Stagnimonas aquatica TaxID=2689987 RepID=A0A3N0V1L9_9GAMM|nr:hypothetical protein [Stagnimonas aquatica]ROH86431.1 hypothetical protein ED208_15450 [Stagnimonas aquatica]